jgi:(E)-4-hydroxy-3-methylbut-2-enyl-diphosphate synthase
MQRRSTRGVTIGDVAVGNGAPISVQSMAKTDTADVSATIAQIAQLQAAGCEIARVAIRQRDALPAFARIVADSPLPVIADVHFDHTIAVEAARLGAAKLRINPGNIGDMRHVDAVIEAAGSAGIPIRIGVNAGSLAAEYAELDWPLAEKLAASAIAFCKHFESRGFSDTVVSVKASSVTETVDAYRRVSAEIDYPLHIGVTEAGPALKGTVKSAVGLGILLAEGIGDTLRVSLTADPAEEVAVAWELLSALGIRRRSPDLVSCPTCGRCQVDGFVTIVNEIAERLRAHTAPITVAVMGCEVNGPGEAREADIGVAFGKNVGLLFSRGEVIRKVAAVDTVDALFEHLGHLESETSADIS